MRVRPTVALVAAIAWAAAAEAAPEAKGPVAAEVAVRHDAGGWTADYVLPRPARAWVFIESAVRDSDHQPWRPGSWTVETRGVRIERRGRYDLLVAEGANVPRQIRIRFRPIQAGLEGAYSPALLFSSGAVALFTDQFKVTPLASPELALGLPADADDVPLPEGPTRMRFSDAGGPILFEGTRRAKAVTTTGQSYALFGSAKVVETVDIATVIDPALPAWLAQEVTSATTRLLAYYAKQLGPHNGPRPMMMASWVGPTPHKVSMTGGVLPGQVMMIFEGTGLEKPDPKVTDFVRWFVAHEAAHFWVGDTVAYDSGNHAWMTEGGADLLAVRALAALDPGYDPRVKLNAAIQSCILFARDRPIESANERSEQDAYYACGAVFGLAAEAAARKASPAGDFASFWRGLIDSNRGDGIVSKAEWLAELTRLSGDPALAASIRRIADEGVKDPKQEITSLLERAGVGIMPDDKGNLRLK